MMNVCFAFLDTLDLKWFSLGNNFTSPLSTFLKSKHFNNVRELFIIVNNKSQFYYLFDDFSEFIQDNFSTNCSIKFFPFDLTCSEDDDLKLFRALSDTFSTERDETKNRRIAFYFAKGEYPRELLKIFTILSPSIIYLTSYYNKIDRLKINKIDSKHFIESYRKYKDCKSMLISNEWKKIPAFTSIIHRSNDMYDLLNRTYQLGQKKVPVLLLGESGTGKELFARAVHVSSGRNVMETHNCAAIHDGTADATLFGWSRGAWTGSSGTGDGVLVKCDKGTIFLDEIADLSLESQARLLRVIENGQVRKVGNAKETIVDVRIIAATNKNIIQLVKENKFRHDLYYRLDAGIIKILPLRERRSDSVLIAEYFLKIINENNKINDTNYFPKIISYKAYDYIEKYSWPGNVRELYNTIYRACIWVDRDIIEEQDIKNNVSDISGQLTSASDIPQENTVKDETNVLITQNVNLEDLTTDFRVKYIRKAIEAAEGNKSRAAAKLGIKQQTLWREIDKLKKQNKLL